MTALNDCHAARAVFVDHDALVAEMVDGLNSTLAERLGDWRRVRFRNTDPPPGSYPAGTTDRLVDAHDWPFESAKMIDAMLAAWHRLLAAMHRVWDGRSEAEQAALEAPPEERH